jgi:excisionase family DNA binding protein
MTANERWVGVAEVAAHLNVNKDSVYRWIDKKGLPAHRIGRLFRFKISEVDEWVKSGVANEANTIPKSKNINDE